MRKAAILFLLLALFACGGGEGDFDPYTPPPPPPPAPEARFEIVAVDKTTTSYHSPSLMITVKNTGAATGYNVSCDAHAKNAAGTIIDAALAFFASLGNIEVGQSALDEAVFFKLSSHGSYVSIDYDCSWLTRH